VLAVMASVGQCLLVLARVDPGGHGHRSLRVDPRTRLMSWSVLFTKQAQKDARKLASASPALKQQAQALLSPGGRSSRILLQEHQHSTPVGGSSAGGHGRGEGVTDVESLRLGVKGQIR
jgi:hypothetical protein